MTGSVNSDLEATLRVTVSGPSGASVDVDCIVDTGFSGALTLPNDVIVGLGLPWLSVQDTELADGRIVLCNTYAGTVVWDGQVIQIEVDEAETDPLLGMALLRGFELNVQVRDGGVVRVTALSYSRVPSRLAFAPAPRISCDSPSN
jgi:clan AA aspartic protease